MCWFGCNNRWNNGCNGWNNGCGGGCGRCNNNGCGGNRESSTENELVFGLHGLGDGELLAAHGELRLADVVARGPAVEDRVVERDAGVFAAVMAHLCPGRPPRVPSLRAAAASRGRFPVPRAHDGSRRSCGGRRGRKRGDCGISAYR